MGVKKLEKSTTKKLDKHIPCGYSMSTAWTCDGIENKHDVYRGGDCMKKFCKSLRRHTMNIINFERKKMIPLTYLNQTKKCL